MYASSLSFATFYKWYNKYKTFASFYDRSEMKPEILFFSGVVFNLIVLHDMDRSLNFPIFKGTYLVANTSSLRR